MRPGDKGPDVQRLQLALQSRGYSLPAFGPDGDFGRETADALQLYTGDHGYDLPPGEVPEHVIASLGLHAAETEDAELGELDLEGVDVYDLRDEQVDPHPKSKTYKGRTLRRAPEAIDSVMLHQAGSAFGQPRGTRDNLALARRSLDVACHAMAFRRGFVALPCPLDWYIHHGNSLNSRALGLEVDGLYPGLIGGATGSGKPPTDLTDATVHTARAAIKLLVHEAHRIGATIKYVYAHRQTDSWRRADPGEGLWRRVVLEYAVPELGLETRPMESLSNIRGPGRHGKPIPAEWDPAGVGRY